MNSSSSAKFGTPEQARVDSDLRASEDRYRRLFDSINEGFCVVEVLFDPTDQRKAIDVRCLATNRAFDGHTGLPCVVGKTLKQVFPEVEPFWIEFYGEVVLTGVSGRRIEQGISDGRWFDVFAFPFGEPDSRQIAVLFSDVTSRRKASFEQAEALRDSKDFTRLALSAVGGVGVWTFDVETDRFVCDEWIARLYGIDPAMGAAGVSRTDFVANVHPDDKLKLRNTMMGGLVKPGDLELEYRILYPDGSVRWVLSRGHTYFDAKGLPVRRTGIGVDMTRQRQLEEQLRQSQKLEAIGQLTGGIAHDFNNALSTISVSIELLRRKMGTAPPEELERYLTVASRGVKGAASLTHRLLAFSRNQTLDMRSVDVNRQANEMADILRRTLGEGISLQLVLDDALWPASTDPHQLESSLLNLAINARDAMPVGGSLTIETGNLHLASNSGAVSAELAPGDYVVVCVSDTGTGMPYDVLRRAFDPFFTTKPIGQGTGLGLSMIYGYAKQSGGHASIFSQVGLGTTVKIFLPRSCDDADRRIGTPDVPTPLRGTGERVLVVEDEPEVRDVVLEVLGEFGYQTRFAGDATSALTLLRGRDAFDLLVTDVGLPGISGRELAESARQLRPDLKVLFITGYAKNAAVRSEFLGPGMDMLSKPFSIEDLATKVYALTRPTH